MARFVREVMNHELFAVDGSARVEDVLDALLDYGITAAPVLDAERRPLGVASLRDLLRPERPVATWPIVTTTKDATVDDAARVMAESGLHHLVVVDDEGRAVGMVSSLDLLRAMVGLPPAHPRSFPHRDPESGLVWTDPCPLDPEHVAGAPDEPGVIVLSAGGRGRIEVDLWAEPSQAMRPRIAELLDLPHADTPALARVLAMRDLRFRCAPVADPVVREGAAARIQRRLSTPPLPRAAAMRP